MTVSFFGVSGWGIRASLAQHHADHTVSFPTKQQLQQGKFEISLDELVSQSGDLQDNASFLLNPTAFNGTLQTLYLSSRFDTPQNSVNYGRRIFQFKDGGIASLDYVLPKAVTKEDKSKFEELTTAYAKENWPRQNRGNRFLSDDEVTSKTTADAKDDSNVLIVLHGLGGGSHEPLIRDLVNKVHYYTGSDDKPIFKETMVLNCRGCSRSKITTPYLFCGFSTGDLREVIEEINEKFPNRKIYLAGYSFGAATLVNYLAEESQRKRQNNIQLAVAVGCPWDLIDSNYRVQNSISGKKLFEPALVSFLTRLVKNNRKELEASEFKDVLDFSDAKLKSIKEIADFDDSYTAKMFNFNSSYEYYRKASPVNRINQIEIPLVAINSLDDPCVGVNLPLREIKTNPYIVQLTSNLGGHLAFIDTKGESWINKQLQRLFASFSATVDSDKKIDSHGYVNRANVFGA